MNSAAVGVDDTAALSDEEGDVEYGAPVEWAELWTGTAFCDGCCECELFEKCRNLEAERGVRVWVVEVGRRARNEAVERRRVDRGARLR